MNNETIQLLRELVESRDVAGVNDLLRREIAADKSNLQIYQAFANIFLQFFDRKNALEAISLIRKIPRQSLRYEQLQQIHEYYKSIGCFDVAIQTARAMLLGAGTDSQRLLHAGTELGGLRQHDEALKCFTRLVKKRPEDPASHFLMGTAQNSCNQADAAESSFNRCIALDARFYPAYLSLSQLKKQSDASNHLDTLKKRLAVASADPKASRFLNFALAKELDDLGRGEESIAFLKAANDAVSLAQPYDHSVEEETFAKIISCYAGLKARIAGGAESRAPIFIVGMPRSGTTLVERVLAANNSVFAAGELHDFIGQFVYQYGLFPERQSLLAIFSKAYQFDYEKIGKGYVDSVMHRSEGRQLFTDKMPFNFRYLGFIKRALPNSKIVHVRRTPQGTLLSNYQQNYRDGVNLWSYDKVSARKYYELYLRYMAYWRAEMAQDFLDVEYEELVQDFAGISRKLYDYCGLQWTDECLRFDKVNIHSGTQSAAQVRQPLYTTSMDKWKDYSVHLSEWDGLSN